MEIMVLL